MKTNKSLLLAAFLLSILLFPCVSHAQTAQGTDAILSLNDAFSAINKAIDALANNSWSRTLGTKIAWALFAMMLVWGFIKSMLLGKGFNQLLADMVQPAIMLGIVLAAISHDFGSAVSKSVEAVSTGVSNSVGVSTKTENEVLAEFAGTAFKVFELKRKDTNLGWGMFEAGIIYVIGMLMKLFAFLIILVSGAIAAGLILMAKIMIGIALGLGPVLFAWGIWKPTEFLFTGWLKFLISAGLQKVVVTVIAGFVSIGLSEMSNLSDKLTGQVTTDVVAYGVLLLFSVLSSMLLMKAPSIAEGLISGGGGMDLNKWTAVAHPVGNTASAGAQSANKLGGAAIGGMAAGINKAMGRESDGGKDSSGGKSPSTVTGYAARGVSALASAAGQGMANAARSAQGQAGKQGGGGQGASPGAASSSTNAHNSPAAQKVRARKAGRA